MLERFEAGFGRLVLGLAALVAISIAAFAILIPLDLLIRNLGWGNMPWLYEGVEYALYVGVFLGAPWVLHERQHVRVDVVVSALPSRLASRLEQAMDAAGAAICAALAYYGIRATVTDFVQGSVPDKLLVIADWWMMLVFAFAFVLLLIEFVLRLRRARIAAAGEAAKGSEAGF